MTLDGSAFGSSDASNPANRGEKSVVAPPTGWVLCDVAAPRPAGDVPPVPEPHALATKLPKAALTRTSACRRPTGRVRRLRLRRHTGTATGWSTGAPITRHSRP